MVPVRQVRPRAVLRSCLDTFQKHHGYLAVLVRRAALCITQRMALPEREGKLYAKSSRDKNRVLRSLQQAH